MMWIPVKRYLPALVFAALLSSPVLAGGNEKPEWANNVASRSAGGYRYFVGVATDAETLEAGLETSWLNALSGIAKTQFPFLLRVTEVSQESLTGSRHLRDVDLAIQRINWKGLEEVADKGSPYFEKTEKDGVARYTVYRFLRWQQSQIEHEEKRLLDEGHQSRVDASKVYDKPVGYQNVPVGTLRVMTQPAGATLLLNGEFVGLSNAEFKSVGMGNYDLTLNLDGYEPIKEKIAVAPGQETTKSIHLERSKVAFEITSTPPDALIFIDNVPLQARTPAKVEHETGECLIRIETPDYYPETKTLNVTHRTTKVDIELDRKPGKISVITVPTGAAVFLDSKLLGKSNLIGQTVDGGEHKLSVELEGFETETRAIDVRSTAGDSLVIKLQPSARADSAMPIKQGWKNKVLPKLLRVAGTVSLGLSVATAIAARVRQIEANESYDKYHDAKTADEARSARGATQDADNDALGFAIASGVLAISSGSFYLTAYFMSPSSDHETAQTFHTSLPVLAAKWEF